LIALEKAVALYFVFIVVQDLLLNFLSEGTQPYVMLKRADEALLVLLFVATLLRCGWRGSRPRRTRTDSFLQPSWSGPYRPWSPGRTSSWVSWICCC